MAISSMDFEYIRGFVRSRAAIVLEPGKEYLVEARLDPLLKSEGLSSVSDLVARLRSQPIGRLHLQVIDAMTTNETLFFRDIAPFDALRQTVLPRLIAARKAERKLSLWCGASSSGQEPYSLAITFKEMGVQLEGWTISMVATDISPTMLARAREGRYSQLEIGRGMPPAFLSKYFVKAGADWQAKDELRRMIEFKELNLADPWPAMPPQDIVLLRNVMIYFDTETKRNILERVLRLLRPDGYLMLGGSETTSYLHESFEHEVIDRASFYRLKGRQRSAA